MKCLSKILALLFLVAFARVNATEQTVTLQDISTNQIFKINITNEFDFLHYDGIQVTSQNGTTIDSLVIWEAQNIDSINLLSSYFVQITFMQRCRMGCGISAAKILAINNGRIVEALAFKSRYRHDFDEMYYKGGIDTVNEHAKYSVSINAISPFTLVLKENYWEISKLHPEDTQEWSRTDTLFFDKKSLIFSNGVSVLDGEYEVSQYKENYKIKVSLQSYPALLLIRQTKVFIDDNSVKEKAWYEVTEDYKRDKVLWR